MTKLHLYDIKNKREFDLEYFNVYTARAFLIKLRYSHNLKCLYYTCDTSEENEILDYWYGRQL